MRGLKYLLSAALIIGVCALYWLRPAANRTRQTEPSKPASPIPSAPLEASTPVLPAAPSSNPAVRASTSNPSDRLVAEITLLLRPGISIERDRLFNDLLPKLVALDPVAATRLMQGLEPGPVREEVLRQLARLMSASDIHATLAWLTGLSATDQPPAAEAVIAQINQTDPAGALEVAAAFRIGLNDGRQEHLIQIWTEAKPAEAMAWVRAQPAGPVRDRLLARTAHVRAQQDPADAASLVLGHMPPGPAQEEALMNVVRQWAVRDPAAAAAWVSQFPSGPLLTRAQAELETARKLR